jgi:aspartate aminotransferase-like enzyme
MAARTHAWVDELNGSLGEGYGILARDGFRSPTVTAITLPEAVQGTNVVAAVRDRGFTIATGYAELKNRCIRIGHMGDHSMQELETLLGVVREELMSLTPAVLGTERSG